MKQAFVYYKDQLAGRLTEDEDGFHFAYDERYLGGSNPQAVSLTLPLSNCQYDSQVMFPFFDGLIPEGWLLDIARDNWKINERDRMSLLMACCKDCIGAISIRTEEVRNG